MVGKSAESGVCGPVDAYALGLKIPADDFEEGRVNMAQVLGCGFREKQPGRDCVAPRKVLLLIHIVRTIFDYECLYYEARFYQAYENEDVVILNAVTRPEHDRLLLISSCCPFILCLCLWLRL